jgi:Fic family protein
MVPTDAEAAALRALRRLNGREHLASLMERFIAEAEVALVTSPASEPARVEFLKLRELRSLLLGV